MKKKFLLITFLFLCLFLFSKKSYANSNEEDIINIVKNIPRHYVFDIDVFYNNEINIAEYASTQLTKYITQLINDDNIKIEVEPISGGGQLETFEMDANIKIYINETLIGIEQFKCENNTQIIMFGLITVPYDKVEKTEQEKILYAENKLKKLNIEDSPDQLFYEIEKATLLNNDDIVLLDTDKFGTIKYNIDQYNNNLYTISHSNFQDEHKPLILILQKNIQMRILNVMHII